MSKKIFIIIFTLIFIIVIALMQTLNQPLKAIGWIPYWDQAVATESFKQNVTELDYISLFWYKIDENGKLGAYEGTVEDKSIIEFAHNNNVKVLALVANLSESGDGTWDHERVDKVISNKDAREKHIDELVDLVEKNNFDGIDIDYEALKSYQKDDFSLFIQELSRELHKKDKILGVAIHPKTSEDNPLEDNGSHAQDLRKIGRYADQLYFMTYLEHGAFSEPGPIGSLSWMDQVIKYGTNKVPRQKVYLGIGLMGAQWSKNPDGTHTAVESEMSFLDVLSKANIYNLTPIWDETSKTPYLTFMENGTENIIWFENAESTRLRISLAKKYGVSGVALWRPGEEDERIWEYLK